MATSQDESMPITRCIAVLVAAMLMSACASFQPQPFVPQTGEEQAIEMANNTSYGLAASLWTQNLKRAHTVSRKLKIGIVWVNCWLFRDLRTPFGGMKQSGVGREGGFEVLRFFTEAQNVCIKL